LSNNLGGSSSATVTADELDQQQIEQLHAATLKASDSCFELKKLCATVLVPASTLVSVFSKQTLNAAVVGAGLMVVAAFWLADGVGYYYQRKLRSVMGVYLKRRADRCEESYSMQATTRFGPIRAMCNASMTFYLILGLLVVLGLLLYGVRVIG
jgi:hypothetical protein